MVVSMYIRQQSQIKEDIQFESLGELLFDMVTRIPYSSQYIVMGLDQEEKLQLKLWELMNYYENDMHEKVYRQMCSSQTNFNEED